MATNFEALGLPGGDIQYEYNRGYFVLFATSGAGGDGSPPVVALVSPPAGNVEAFQAIVIDVIDNVGLGRIFVVADLPGSGREELVYRGDRFTTQYAAQSTQTAIPGGVRLSIKRSAGWPSSPTLVAYAVDLSGTTE